VGFEFSICIRGRKLERETSDREQCLVLLSGRASVSVDGQNFGADRQAAQSIDGKPYGIYVPARSQLSVERNQLRARAVLGRRGRPVPATADPAG